MNTIDSIFLALKFPMCTVYKICIHI